MIDALLVSEDISNILSVYRSSQQSELESWFQSSSAGTSFDTGNKRPLLASSGIYSAYSMQETGLIPWSEYQGSRTVKVSSENTGIENHLRQARLALEELARLNERTQEDRQLRQEMKWLAENRAKFRGKWVALHGNRLLAAEATAREVFAKVADQQTPPLVIRIEEDELPFGGW
jgi:hypothetical protein